MILVTFKGRGSPRFKNGRPFNSSRQHSVRILSPDNILQETATSNKMGNTSIDLLYPVNVGAFVQSVNTKLDTGVCQIFVNRV